MGLTTEEGRRAVALARRALDERVGDASGKGEEPLPQVFSDLRGVFVTLNSAGGGAEALRGCIGFPYPSMALGDAIKEAAVAAATEDPRFQPVTKRELESIVVEVSVLTPPQVLRKAPAERPSAIRVGEDGLIISIRGQSGLLLPQVATEYGLGPKEFLAQACLKAGLSPDAWLDVGTQVQVFQAEVFSEESPRGNVVRMESPRPAR